jgi:type IV pilus assembly protein PilB
MVVVTEPTGAAGHHAYAALSEIATPDEKIITIQDPVEYQVPRSQVPVNEERA